MTAVGNILLRIGSEMGPGGFASLQSAIQMIGQLAGAVKDAVIFLDEYAEKMSLVDMELINYADKMSKAQVGSLGLMSAMGRLNIAGVQVTKEQFAAMSVAADDYADRIGGSPVEAMDSLTSAIIRGSERGLKPFGIEVDATNKKMDGTAQALDQIGKKFGDVDGDVKYLSEAFVGIKNNTTDFFGAIWNGITSTGGPFTSFLSEVSDLIGDTAEKLSELDRHQKDYFFGLGASADGLKLIMYDLKEAIGIMDDIDRTKREVIESNIMAVLTGGRLGMYEGDRKVGGKESRLAQDAAELAAKTVTASKAKSSGGKAKDPTDDEILKANWENYQAQRDFALSGEHVDPNEYALGAYWSGNARDASGDMAAYNMGGLEAYGQGDISKYEEASDRANTTIEERIEAQKELDEMIKQGAENLESQMTMDEINHDAIMGYREEEMLSVEAQIALEDELANSFEARSARVADGAQRIADAWQDVNGMINMVADAYENGTENMSTAQAVFYYIDCVIGAAVEAAKAVASIASQNYLEGALHVAAAAAYTSAAALAATHGGGGSVGTTSTVSSIGPASTAGQYSGGYDRGEGADELTIHLTMGDTEKAMGWIVDQNYRRARSGEPHFQEAA